MERVQFSALICTLLSHKGICNFTMGGDEAKWRRRQGLPVSDTVVLVNLCFGFAGTIVIVSVNLKLAAFIFCKS